MNPNDHCDHDCPAGGSHRLAGRGQTMRTAFTLMELLLVIAIIGVLSTLGLAVMQSAQEDARIAATQSRIQQIGSLLREEFERYELRRMPVSLATLRAAAAAQAANEGWPAGNTLVHAKNLRYRIMTDIIRAEFPHPDLTGFDSDGNPIYAPNTIGYGGFSDPGRPQIGVLGQYPLDTEFNAAPLSGLGLATNPPAGVTYWANINTAFPTTAASTLDLPAEYLYLIISRIDSDGVTGLEALGDRVVGDSDGDGIPEIVDAWDDPLDYQLQYLDATSSSPGVWLDIPNQYIDANSVVSPVPRPVRKLRIAISSRNFPAG